MSLPVAVVEPPPPPGPLSGGRAASAGAASTAPARVIAASEQVRAKRRKVTGHAFRDEHVLLDAGELEQTVRDRSYAPNLRRAGRIDASLKARFAPLRPAARVSCVLIAFG